jgi:hypothetical protein
VFSSRASLVSRWPGHSGHRPILRFGPNERIVKKTEGEDENYGDDEGDGSPYSPPITERRDRSDETAADGEGRGLGAAVDPELGEEVADVGLHRARADKEGQGDLLVRVSLGEQTQHVHFTRR